MTHQVVDQPTRAPRRPAAPRHVSLQEDAQDGPQGRVDLLAAAVVLLGALGVILVGLALIVAVLRVLLPEAGALVSTGAYAVLPVAALAAVLIVALRENR